jgi:hypothetical protein
MAANKYSVEGQQQMKEAEKQSVETRKSPFSPLKYSVKGIYFSV